MMTVWCEPLHVSFFPSNFSVFSPQSLLPYAIIIFFVASGTNIYEPHSHCMFGHALPGRCSRDDQLLLCVD
jgi:hypothetical protein